ncbi:GntR family transcriptional regulator [Sulfobacillus sp. hq2]|nr:GntR family transcriptional regulator [Sulfobacillus sp. hq2]
MQEFCCEWRISDASGRRKALSEGDDSSSALRPIVAQGLAEEVLERLKQAILDGDLRPGQRLIEHTLANELGVSRTPVREALKHLAAEGLVTVDGRRGLVVSRLSLEVIEEAYMVREVLEGLAARLASEHPYDPADLQKLQRALDAMEQGGLSPKAFDAVHGEFHDTVRNMAHNAYLDRYLGELAAFRTRMVSLDWIPKTRVTRSLEEHRSIYEAIRDGRSDDAERLARQHVASTRKALLQRLQDHADA